MATKRILLAIACAIPLLAIWAGNHLLLGQASAGPERWEKDIQRFETEDAQNPPAPGGIVFVGSSSIRLWKTKEAFPDLAIVNRGFGGSQMADSVHYAQRIVTRYRPRLVVFYAGDNDIAAGKKPEGLAADFERFVASVRKDLPEVRIVFIAIKPSVARWKQYDSQKAANRRIEEYCQTEKGITYLDMATPMLDSEGKPRPELFVQDGLHLNEAGYKVWNELIRPHLLSK